MSGLLALLDDVAAIAKVAAASVDDVMGMAAKAGSKAAGVVIDAIRYLQVAREEGIVGALRGPSAWTQKTPPVQMMYSDAKFECEALSRRVLTDQTKSQIVR